MMPKGECVYIRQSHESLCYNYVRNMLHFLALTICPKLTAGISQLLNIVIGTRCDCGSIFCHCYDVLGLYFVVPITFMHNGSECGFKFIKLKDLIIMGQNRFQLLHNDKIIG